MAINNMSKDPHEVFKTREDYERWESYIIQSDLIEGFSSDQQQRAKPALEYLRQVFGKGFLKYANKNRHPLLYLLMQASAWQRVPLIELAEALEALKDAENFNRIPRLLKGNKKNRQTINQQFNEGYSVIKIAHRFFEAGLRVCFIDDKGSKKKPDLKLVDDENGQEIFIEISTQIRSDKLVKAREASDPIWGLFFGPIANAGLVMHAKMKQGFDQSKAIITLNQITPLIEEVKTNGELQELDNDYIVVGIAPQGKTEQLKQWALEKEIDSDIVGPPIILNELSRLMRKIGEKIEQLPKDKPGIIFIPLITSFLFYAHELDEILTEIEKQVSMYPNLLALILSNGDVDKLPDDVAIENLTPHIIVKTTKSGIIGPIVILENQSFTLNITSTTLAKLRKAFR